MPHIEIDGRHIEVEAGTMIIEAAKQLDIYIPHFCYHPKLSVAANCRMCLVEVEKVAKPLPACATPVADGMRVFTRSAKTKQAQKGVMEFLLINHPLDCPICDQGGECDLQDLAVGFGGSHSRYYELKRVVRDKDIGPLIATEMTRCIHCTRCVRFGQEIAGIMELGATGRGEHMEIGTYIERSLTSELIGNVIDLCPVGALTSKPFRYTARPWELKASPSVCPHCSTGCNVEADTRNGQIMRVLPRDNEPVNESWICDKGRFSYAGLQADDRLAQPMVKHQGAWHAVTWEEALAATVEGLRRVLNAQGADQIGALASARATTEELFLFQRLMRALGVRNIDHRLNQADTRADAQAPLFPALNVTLEELQAQPLVLLVGANPRKQQPMTNHRLRKAALAGNRIMAINGRRYDFNYPVYQVTPAGAGQEAALLAQLLGLLDGQRLAQLPSHELYAMPGGDAERLTQIAQALQVTESPLILLGSDAAAHPQAAELDWLAAQLAAACGGRLGRLADFGNSAGAWLSGCVPHRLAGGQPAAAPGLSAHEMLQAGLKAYVLLDVEPGLEAWDGAQARRALKQADFVVSLSPFAGEASEYAQVMLPIASFLESAGTLINNEGRVQSIRPTARLYKEARPSWKVLRVLGNLLHLDGFQQNDVAEVTKDWESVVGLVPLSSHGELPKVQAAPRQAIGAALWRLGSWPIYRTDALVRRSEPLRLAQGRAQAAMHPEQARQLGLESVEEVVLCHNGQPVSLPLVLDAGVPLGCVAVPAGYEETVALGPLYGAVQVQLNR
ncbi:MAG: NADH-quinone oxidoreductase subunit NuoG [Pseudomonadota bacterium]